MKRMMISMALFALVGCGGGAATTGGTTGGASGGTTGGTSGGSSDSSIAFRNSSSWAIRNLYMSTVEQNTWGPDQLGAHVIHTGESYTITGIPCANYDLKLVDEDNDECIVRNVNVCAESTGVNITSEALLGCQAATRAQ